MNKEELVNKLIKPYKSPLSKNELRSKAKKITGRGTCSKFMINTYGCEKCALKDTCEDYPHTSGICPKRSKMYVAYLKQGQDDTVPLMIDQLSKLSTERDIEYEKGIKAGKLTEEFFRLNYLCMQLSEKVNKATEGTKLKVEHTWFDDMRSTLTVEGKVIELEDETDKRDSHDGDTGTEENLLEQVKRSRQVP